jgi:hypothetical protein
MATEVNVVCTIDETEVRVCYPPINSPGGSGITGLGSVDRVLKVLTLVGADGTAIVTVGNSDIVESGTTRTMRNSFGNVVFDYENALLKSKAGGLSINGDSRLLIDTVGDTQLDWENKWLFKNGATGSGFFVPTGIKHNGSNTLLLEISTNKIYSSDGNNSAKFEDRELSNTGNYTTLNWEQQQLFSASYGNRFNWNNGTFTDDTQLLEVTVNQLAILGVLQAAGGGTRVLTTDNSGVLSWGAGGGGSGTVTTVSVVTANGVSGSVANPTTTPAITLTLGAITPTSINGLTITTSTGTLTIANGKTITINNTLTLNGTDGTTITLPTATSTVLANNLGLSGGTTLIGGTAATDKVIFQSTSGNQVTGTATQFRFLGGNNGASSVLNIGDGLGANIGELGMWAAGQTSTTTHFVRAGTNFTYFNAGTDLRIQIGGTSLMNVSSSTVNFIQGLTIADAKNIVLNTTTGTKIGTATTQKLGFYNKTPIVQQANTAGAVTAGAVYTAQEQSMLTDAYTCLRNMGLLS